MKGDMCESIDDSLNISKFNDKRNPDIPIQTTADGTVPLKLLVQLALHISLRKMTLPNSMAATQHFFIIKDRWCNQRQRSFTYHSLT